MLQEMLVCRTVGSVDVSDVASKVCSFLDQASKEGKVHKRQLSVQLGVNFLAIGAKVTSESLVIVGIGISTTFVVGIDPGFYAGVFRNPSEKDRTQEQAIAGDSYGGGPLVAPPAVVKHAGWRLHVVPKEFSVEFPVPKALYA